MSRPGLHPAILLAGGLHDFARPAAPVVCKPCVDCGATENTHSVERWVSGTPEREIGHWTRKTICCGAERDELGRKPRSSHYAHQSGVAPQLMRRTKPFNT